MTNHFHFSSCLPEDSTIAVGDIHGCYDQFAQFLDWVRGSNARVILLGDLIDRGPNDLAVLERVRDLLQDPDSWGLESFVAIRGNHEQMFLDALDGYMGDWAFNGGDYRNLDKLEVHADWIRALPYYVVVGDTLFSHAGCYPGRDPADYMGSFHLREQFVWLREPFLSRGPKLDAWSSTLKKVVFGHTPQGPLPYRIPEGVCIDTGCFRTGVLTAYNATCNTFNQFELA